MFLSGFALAYVPGKTPSGADRHWISNQLSVHLIGPTVVDGHDVHQAVRNAGATWNAIDHARIDFMFEATVDRVSPSIGNGRNEFGWVEESDSPYFTPGVPCTTATIYDTLTGVMEEADTTCDAMAFQWPADLFGLYTQDNVVDAESAALSAFGSWLGLDASLDSGEPMYPEPGPGTILRDVSLDDVTFGRHVYGDGTSTRGSINGTVRFQDGSPIPYAYVVATSASGDSRSGAVAGAGGAYTIFELPAGTYTVIARPLTTDPYILSSTPYRSNPIRNLDFSPELFANGSLVQVQDGVPTLGIDITVFRTGSDPDLYEPNGSAATASPLALGYSKLATTHVPFDRDWYSFQTVPGTCYVVATAFHGASIVPVLVSAAFWSRTRLSLYDGGNLIGVNESRDETGRDPRSWISYCEMGPGRRLDIEVEQRDFVAGAGYFYAVFAQAVPSGSSIAPIVNRLYPDTGWSHRNRYVWIDGSNFMPGARVDVRLSDGTWAPASPAAADRCDAAYRCAALKARLPPGPPGAVDVKVTNPNGVTTTALAAFTYLVSTSGPMTDRTPVAFGYRYGVGNSVCVADYDGDGTDDILKTRRGGLPLQLFRNNADGTFTDVAAASGAVQSTSVFGGSCAWVDVDDDGDLDAYVTNIAYSFPNGATNGY